ncbi:hypothetical protein [Paenibacillus sp. sgz5001063]|uniref:hypothetical protein n=1 Tax=Paenibacillus sp. sgz5001063 TaxID=3242474 RepID=UPI0036D406C7
MDLDLRENGGDGWKEVIYTLKSYSFVMSGGRLGVTLQGLHPEYEVTDWRGRTYFADFAWMPRYVKLLIEIKGYASHVRDMDRQKYCSELNRETFLFAMGYHVISLPTMM